MRASTPKYSDVELLDSLKKEAKKLGRTPTMADLDRNKIMPSSKTYVARFGRWLIALQKAGLEPEEIHRLNSKEIQERKQKIIDVILQAHRDKGALPTVWEIEEIIPSSTVERFFGSWNNAVKAAGLVPRSKKEYLYLSRDELLQFIKDFYNANGRIPKISDFYAKKGIPSPATYKKRFGGWSKAIELAGFKPPPFPYKPIACEYHEGCFIKNGKLSLLKKVVLYLANKCLIFVKSGKAQETA